MEEIYRGQNFKAKRTKDNAIGELTAGKIYEFIDGVTVDDTGKKRYDLLYTVKDIKYSKYWELVEITKPKSILIILSGETASSKDTTLQELINQSVVKPLISHTTRPKRECEVDGREYYFVEEFDENDYAESRKYKVQNGDIWYYGLSKQELMNASTNVDNYIVIVDVQGMEGIKNYIMSEGLNIDVITVMLTAPVGVRIMRSINRESSILEDDIKALEVCRRILADSEEISPYKNKYDVVLQSNDEDLIRNVRIIKTLVDK